MPGLCFSNELISRDEGLHCDFACLLFKTLYMGQVEVEKVKLIFHEAVDLEKKFITEALRCDLIGINAGTMKEYIEFCANRLFLDLFTEEIYPGAKNPFPWMELISLQGKTNFFEKRVGEYAKNLETDKFVFKLDEDF